MKTSLFLEHETDAAGITVRALLRVAGDPPPAEGRIPLNLSLVLDRSGSMTGEPLEAAKDAARHLLRRLRPEDTASVVAFGSDVTTVAEPATGEDQAHLPAQIRAIETEGMTNLSGGWLRGRELVAQHLEEDGVNRVILLTDGHANEGVTDPRSSRRSADRRPSAASPPRRSASGRGTTSASCRRWPMRAAGAPTTSSERTRRPASSRRRSRGSWGSPPRTSASSCGRRRARPSQRCTTATRQPSCRTGVSGSSSAISTHASRSRSSPSSGSPGSMRAPTRSRSRASS
jgi:hypothetical protein